MLEWFDWDTWLALIVLLFGVLFLYLRERYNLLRSNNRLRWAAVVGMWMAAGHLVLLGSVVWWDGMLIGLVIGTLLLLVGEVSHRASNLWRRLTGRRANK
jgi:hypothetical protein